MLLAVSLRDATTVRSAAVRAGVSATAGGLVGLRFVVPTVDRFSDLGVAGGVLALVLLALMQSLGWAAGAALAQHLRARVGVPFALAFGVVCLVACSAPGVFTWTPAGLLAARPELLQFAEFVGERGVSVLLAVLAAVAVSGRTRRSRAMLALVSIVLLVGLDRAGSWRMDVVTDRPVDGRVTVALLDPGAPAERSVRPEEQVTRVERLRRLSTTADAAGAAFVVWPESAYPVALPRDARTLTGGSLAPIDSGTATPRVFGLRTIERRQDGGVRQFNSATLITPDGRLARPVDKRRLLWFGETPPFFDVFPPLADVFDGARRITPGERPLALTVPGSTRTDRVRLGVLICYEDVDPAPARAVARDLRPQLLVNLTNDAWFAGTTVPKLQARLAAVRAVETRTALVRAVNAGGGGWVDAAGRAQPIREVQGQAVVLAHPALRRADAGPTFYARVGDGPSWLAGLLLVGVCAARRPAALALSPGECQ